MELAASAIGIIGVAAQTVEIVIKVRNFVHDVKDAPADIKNLATELQILTEMLSGIEMQVKQTNRPAFSDLSPALHYCQHGLGEIASSVTELEVNIAKRKKRGSLRAVLAKDEHAKHLGRIERAKSSLSLAYSSFTNGLMMARMDQLDARIDHSTTTIIKTAAMSGVSSTQPQAPEQGQFPINNQKMNMVPRKQHSVARERKGWSKAQVRFWILNRSLQFLVKQSTAGWDIRIRTHRILSSDSKFFKACENADLPLVQHMLSSGEASPFDQTERGITGPQHFLLRVSIVNNPNVLRFTEFGIREGLYDDAGNESLYPAVIGHLDCRVNSSNTTYAEEMIRLLNNSVFEFTNEMIFKTLFMIEHSMVAKILQEHAWPPWQVISLSERIKSIELGSTLCPRNHFIIGTESGEEIWKTADMEALQILIKSSYTRYAEACSKGMDLTLWRCYYKIALGRGASLPDDFMAQFLGRHFVETGTTLGILDIRGPRYQARDQTILDPATEAFARELQQLDLDLELCGRKYVDKWFSRTLKEVLFGDHHPAGQVLRISYGSQPSDWRIWFSERVEVCSGEADGGAGAVPLFMDYLAEVSDTSLAAPLYDMPGAWPDKTVES